MNKTLLILSTMLSLQFGYAEAKNGMPTLEIAAKTSSAEFYSFGAAMAAARVEQKKARKMGFEWNSIPKLIRVAIKKNKAGNVKQAIKLLETAKEHGILGQKQAIDQLNAGPNF